QHLGGDGHFIIAVGHLGRKGGRCGVGDGGGGHQPGRFAAFFGRLEDGLQFLPVRSHPHHVVVGFHPGGHGGGRRGGVGHGVVGGGGADHAGKGLIKQGRPIPLVQPVVGGIGGRESVQIGRAHV